MVLQESQAPRGQIYLIGRQPVARMSTSLLSSTSFPFLCGKTIGRLISILWTQVGLPCQGRSNANILHDLLASTPSRYRTCAELSRIETEPLRPLQSLC
jgi:hypothetical protein